MAIDEVVNGQWIRKHDHPGASITAAKILYPKGLRDLIEICSTRAPDTRLRAAGSHWALSPAAVSDQVFVETHDPRESFTAMGRTRYEVVPGCLNTQFVEAMAARHPVQFGSEKTVVSTLNAQQVLTRQLIHDDPNHPQTVDEQTNYLVHIETGKRIYQLYAELDQGEESIPVSLASFLKNVHGNDDYRGPWAFRTLGGAGGQTVFGALTTGTHGGDHRLPPIADDVAALHLVTDGGKHYWIEPRLQPEGFPLTDDAKLIEEYGIDVYGGRDNFEILRDDGVFNAVLVSAGRFGIVYSIVLRAVRQFSLHEERRLAIWQDVPADGAAPFVQGVRGLVGNPSSELYSRRFLQIAICLTSHKNFQRNRCGITKRWNVAPRPDAMSPNGRSERVGGIVEHFNFRIQGPRFEFAGNSHVYSPDPSNPNKAAPPDFLERACANANFIDGIINTICAEIREFLNSGDVIQGTLMAEVLVPGVGSLLLLAHALTKILEWLMRFWAHVSATGSDRRLGQVMDDLKSGLLDRADPEERAAGVFVWQAIANAIFALMQDDLDYDAISYAVMDRHDYADKSCNVNVDSIEVFFDATDPMLVGFVDALLAFESWQEWQGKAFVGYVSMRFTGQTRALLGMSRHPLTCAVEVAGLKDVGGTTDLIDFAMKMSLNRNLRCVLHWGQRNEADAATTEDRFGDGAHPSGGDLGAWRNALAALTDSGRLDGFSSAFTRKTGLEVA